LEDIHKDKGLSRCATTFEKGEKSKEIEGGGWRVVNFIYKRLGVFCFLCGTQKKSAKGVLSLMMTMEKEGEAQKSG